MQAVQNYQQSLAINATQPELYQRIGALNVRLASSAVSSTGTTFAGAPTPDALKAESGTSTNSASNANNTSEPRR